MPQPDSQACVLQEGAETCNRICEGHAERERERHQLQVDSAYLNHNASLLLFSVALAALCEHWHDHTSLRMCNS